MDAEYRAVVAEPAGSRWLVAEQGDDFAELLPLTRTPANSPAAEALILAHAYYEAQSLFETRERNELAVELALHPLDSDEERQQLLAWLHQQPEAMVIN